MTSIVATHIALAGDLEQLINERVGDIAPGLHVGVLFYDKGRDVFDVSLTVRQGVDGIPITPATLEDPAWRELVGAEVEKRARELREQIRKAFGFEEPSDG